MINDIVVEQIDIYYRKIFFKYTNTKVLKELTESKGIHHEG